MRYLAILIFAAVLAAPFVLRRAIVSKEDAKRSGPGAERLVIVTPHIPEIRNEYARVFRAWHQAKYGSEVELDFRIPGGTSDVKRMLESTYRAYRDAHDQLPAEMPTEMDLAWGGGDYFYYSELQPLGILQPLHMPAALLKEFRAALPQPTLAGVKLYDATVDAQGAPTPQWIGVCLSSFGICYNPDVYRALKLPEPSAANGWHDLTNPRLAGFVALADPAHSGSSAVAYQMVIQRSMADAETELFARHAEIQSLPRADRVKNPDYRRAIAAGWKRGMGELLKIAANARYFTDASPVVPMDVSRGEAAAGMAIDFYARVTAKASARAASVSSRRPGPPPLRPIPSRCCTASKAGGWNCRFILSNSC